MWQAAPAQRALSSAYSERCSAEITQGQVLQVRRCTLLDINPGDKGMVSHNTKVSKELNKYFLNEQIRALCVTHLSRVKFLSNTHMTVISEVRSDPCIEHGNTHSGFHSQKPANTSWSRLC